MSQLADLMVAMHQDGLPPDVQASNMKAFRKLFEALGEPHADVNRNLPVHGDVLGLDSGNSRFHIGGADNSVTSKRISKPNRGLNVASDREHFIKPIHLKDLLP